MPRASFTGPQLDWLAQAYRVSRVPELTRRYNLRWGTDYTPAQIKGALTNHGLKSGRGTGLRKGELRPGEGNRVYTDAEIAWLAKHYRRLDRGALAQQFAARFGRVVAPDALAQRCRYYDIRSGRTGCFEDGNEPWNKGLKGCQAGGRSSATRFRPGNHPPTTVPVGSYTQDPDGYWLLKVSDRDPERADKANAHLRDWRFVHRLTYESHHGPIPAGHVVILIDGDKEACLDPANVACLSRAELARLNQAGFGDLPPDRALRRAAIARARLVTAAHEAARAAGFGLQERRRLLGGGGQFPAADAAAAERAAASRFRPGDDPRRNIRSPANES
jgi:hypothetical protein